MSASAPAPAPAGDEDAGSNVRVLEHYPAHHRGWRPCTADWVALVTEHKPLTDQLRGRTIALSSSNKSADAAFARGLEVALKAEGAEAFQLEKWPAKKWVEGCCRMAESADFAIVLTSKNYDQGHATIAERYMIKEGNFLHLIIVIDSDADEDVYCATPADAITWMKSQVPLNQQARVDCNVKPCTWSWNSLEDEDKAQYRKILAKWSPPKVTGAMPLQTFEG